MITKVQVHSKVEKAMQQMKRQDNAPKVAAMRAGEIIDALVAGVRLSHAGRFSRKKDTRIKNVFKFNLGSGYRMISIKEQDTLYILFIGDHDQCDRWLDTYSQKSPHKIPMPLNRYGVSHMNLKNKTHKEVLPKVTDNNITDNDMDCLPDIAQEDLRKVFCGLVGNH